MRSMPAIRVLLAVLIVLPQPLLPATLTVDGTGSVVAADGECSLREAIENTEADADVNADCAGVGAYGDDTIELTVDVVLDTVDNTDGGLPNGLPRIFSSLEVNGNGRSIRRDTGASNFRLFAVAGGDLTLRGVELSGGKTSGSGGSVLNLFGNLTVVDSTISGNEASSTGGGISQIAGTATLIRTVVSDNMAGDFSLGGGLAITQGAVMTLSHSTVSGNSALRGGGVFLDATLQIDDSTISDNSASYGGGINNGSGTLTITNSTISGNSAGLGGGGIYNDGTTTITNSTLSGNSAVGDGVAIYNYDGTAYVAKSLIANSSGGGNCYGAITHDGANLADDSSCGTIPNTLTGLDRTLADNGGPTMTHALLPGSNAIDIAGTPSGPERSAGADACSSTDQRGAGREGNCDSGAFEFLTCADLVLSGETIASTESRTNCKKIIVEGPDFTVAGTGDLTLRAGTSIEVGNGTRVESGGALTLVREGSLQVGNTVFTTSLSYLGDFGGISVADANCNERAAAAGLSGSFKAWLSANTGGSPADNFTRSDAPYVRTDGVRIADNWSDLTDGVLLAPISLDEFGNPASLDNSWTATLTDGTLNPAIRDCISWTSSSDTFTGWLGGPYFMGPAWTESGNAGCNEPKTLYCFEQ